MLNWKMLNLLDEVFMSSPINIMKETAFFFLFWGSSVAETMFPYEAKGSNSFPKKKPNTSQYCD